MNQILKQRLTDGLDCLPTCSDYTDLLGIVGRKFNLTINQSRDMIGKLTYKEINQLLNA